MRNQPTSKLLKRIFDNYIIQHKFKLFIAFICMAIIAAATATNAWLMQPVLDEIFIKKKSKINLYYSYSRFAYSSV